VVVLIREHSLVVESSATDGSASVNSGESRRKAVKQDVRGKRRLLYTEFNERIATACCKFGDE
jgi:hypothetical protein